MFATCKFCERPLTAQKKKSGKGLLTVIVIKLLSVNQYSVILDQAIVPGTESIEGIRPYSPHLY